MIDDLLWKRLTRCRTVRITLSSGVPDDGSRLIRVRLTGKRWESVSFTLRKGETVPDLVRRALDTLDERQAHGMPKPNPKAAKERRLRQLLHSADTKPM